MDFVIYELVKFTEVYCKSTRKPRKVPGWIKWVLLADAIQLLINPVTKHAFDVRWDVINGEVFYFLVPLAGQYIHRLVDYGLFFAVIITFAITIFRNSRIYREKFIIMFVSILAVGVWETVFILSKNPIDRSMIGLGALGILAYYFSIHYRPLRLLDKMLSGIVSNGNDACFIFSPKGRCVWVNKAACNLIGVMEDNCENAPEEIEYLFNIKLRRGNWSERHSTGSGDSIKYYLFENRDVLNENGKITGFYLKISDVTKEQLKIRRELFEATHDMLTGLYTSDHLYKIVKQAIDVHKDTDYMILYINIKSFKVVNDIFGNDFGDYAIKCFAERMKAAFSKRCLYGRLGGANFGVLIPKDEFNPEAIERQLALIKITQDSANYPIQSQTGAYEVDRAEKDIATMFANARLALTSIEKDDSVHMAIYDDKLRNEILWNQEITAQLADAIKNRDLRPYLQPIADSDGNNAYLVQHIEKIISSIRTDRHIRRIQTHMTVRIHRIVRFRIDHSFIAPVPKVGYRSRPAYIISQAEGLASETVMGSVYIDSVAEHIRFPVRDIFPGRKIGIDSLFPPGISDPYPALFMRFCSASQEEHFRLFFCRIWLPDRKPVSVGTHTVRILGFHKGDKIIAHLPGQIIVTSGKGSPAFPQGFKEEPEIRGMEGPRLVPSGHVRIKPVIVKLLAASFLLRLQKSSFYRSFHEADLVFDKLI